eukprot:jgi/Chrzof1/8814/Cz03g25160.t1
MRASTRLLGSKLPGISHFGISLSLTPTVSPFWVAYICQYVVAAMSSLADMFEQNAGSGVMSFDPSPTR